MDITLLRIAAAPKMTALKFWRYHKKFAGDLQTILKHMQEPCLAEADAQHIAQQCRAAAVTCISAFDREYPPMLASLADRPPLLYAKGDISLLQKPAVSVVGSRAASYHAHVWTGNLARAAGQEGLCIVSGMAKGIDAAAHEGSMQTGTIAVPGCGADVVYPACNRALYEEIIARGLILGEYPPGTKPLKMHFPQRNRLIAALGHAVIIAQAGLRSGSLITARIAADIGRDVFAVPGPPWDESARGGNYLLRQGAILIEDISDLLENLGPGVIPTGTQAHASPAQEQMREPAAAGLEPISDEAALILDKLSYTPVPFETLAQVTGLPADRLMSRLTFLELEGRIRIFQDGISLQ